MPVIQGYPNGPFHIHAACYPVLLDLAYKTSDVGWGGPHWDGSLRYLHDRLEEIKDWKMLWTVSWMIDNQIAPSVNVRLVSHDIPVIYYRFSFSSTCQLRTPTGFTNMLPDCLSRLIYQPSKFEKSLQLPSPFTDDNSVLNLVGMIEWLQRRLALFWEASCPGYLLPELKENYA